MFLPKIGQARRRRCQRGAEIQAHMPEAILQRPQVRELGRSAIVVCSAATGEGMLLVGIDRAGLAPAPAGHLKRLVDGLRLIG
jgi:hypothetical protein